MENTLLVKNKPTKLQCAMLIFFTAIIIAIIIIDLVFLLTFNKDSNVILHNPVKGSTYPTSFTAAGYAWDRNSIEKGENIDVTILLTRILDDNIQTYDAERSSVKYQQKVLFNLSTFSCTITLPETENTEDWDIVARMTTPSGNVMETTPRRIRIDSRAKSREFRFFSLQHIFAIILILAGAGVIFFLFRNNRNKHLRTYTAFFLALVLLTNELVYHIYWRSIGIWLPSNALMIHMCGISIIIIPYVLFTWNEKIRKYLGEITYFWGLGGALQALLSPDINVHGFPEYKFFSFFISHGFIIIIALFIILAFNLEIGLWAYIRTFIITNTAVIIMLIVNPLFKNIAPFEVANYFAVGYPPPDGSIIDLFVEIFGPSPWYAIGLEIMGVVLFALLCVPFLFKKKKPAGE